MKGAQSVAKNSRTYENEKRVLGAEKVKHWYEELFENYAEGYDREQFARGTVQEVDFIEQELGRDRTIRILDVGCGTGRHAVELAKRGYTVTGIDLSRSLLDSARKKAQQTGVKVEFRQQDARDLDFRGEFDAALLFCEGAFPLMETDEMNFRILQGVRKALRTPGRVIITTLNALYPLHHDVDELINAGSEEERSSGSSFDLMTFRMASVFEMTDDSGRKRSLTCNERYYAPSEMSWLLNSLGFRNIEIFGCTPGQFSRDRKLTPDEFEMLVIAEC